MAETEKGKSPSQGLAEDAAASLLAAQLIREKDLDVLSSREKQVLELVAVGQTTPQIADRLALSPKTVSRHRERIMNKLDMHTNAD